MAKTSSKKGAAKAQDLEPYDTRTIDLSKFKPDLTVKDWQEMFKPFGTFSALSIFDQPIETLSCTKTSGRGRTNLTLIMPTIVQVDAATPFASFDRRSTPSRDPVVQMHFEPSAYGIIGSRTYVMAFVLDVSGQSTFNLQGFAGSGTISGTGNRTVSGKVTVSLVFRNVPASQQIFGFVEQKAGGQWTWFSTRVSFPPLVISL